MRPSLVLGKSLYDDQGQVLVAAGVTLTDQLIEAIRIRGYTSIYIRDGVADDVIPVDLLDERVRTTVAAHVRALFSLAAAHAGGDVPHQPSDWPNGTARVLQDLYAGVETILDEVFSVEALVGMAALKSYDNYTFEHSVETAVVGVMLGKRLGLQRSDLRLLGLGCLMHDLGKRSLEVAVLNKPGPLSPEETLHVREHPRAGYDLVVSLGLDSTVPQHVAWQHHERQDGSGYPRGLHGANRIARFRSDLAARGRIMLMAELTAVADVYSALSSDRPYRAALPPDHVASLMQSMAGHHLNREAVQAFFRVVPTYPVGLRVVLSGPPFDGWRGVVVSVEPSHLQRPVVRLLQDAQGRPVDVEEVDLHHLPDLTLASDLLEPEAVV